MSITLGRPKSTQAGKLKKVWCENCGHTCYETHANLRDFPRWECCGQPLTVQDATAAAITPEGRDKADAEYAYGENRKALGAVQADRISRYPQLRCKSCSKPQTVDHSHAILANFEKVEGAYGGGEIRTSYTIGQESTVENLTCGKCGGDTFEAMRKRGKTAKQKKRADDLPF